MTGRKSGWRYAVMAFALSALAVWNEAMDLLYSSNGPGNAWQIAAILISVSLSGLPLFAVLFGNCTFVTKFSFSDKALWRKIIPVTVLACSFWWILTALLHMRGNYPGEEDLSTLQQCLGEVLESPANIRFCHMICSALILYPLLRRVYQNPQITRYCVIVLLLFTIIEPILKLIPFMQPVTLFTDQINWGFFRAWAFYLTLGVYINQIRTTWKSRLLIYCLAVLSIGIAYWIISATINNSNSMDYSLLEFGSPLSALQALAVIVFVKERFGKSCNKATRYCVRQINLNGLWTCVPLAFVAASVADILPLPEDSRILLLAERILIIMAIVSVTYCSLSRLNGFKRILGIYDKNDGGSNEELLTC